MAVLDALEAWNEGAGFGVQGTTLRVRRLGRRVRQGQVARVLEELHAGDLAGSVAGGYRQARALEQAADRLEGWLGKDAGGAARRVLRAIDPGNEPLRAFAADPHPREAP